MVLKITDKVKFLLRILSCITVCTLTIIIGIQVVNRYVFGTSFTWVEELAGMAMIYITYFGAAMATVNNSNTRIDFFIRKLPGPVYRGFEILDDCICVAFFLVICRYAVKLVGTNLHALSAAMKIPLAVNYVGVLSGCVLMIVFYLLRLWIDVEKFRGRNMDYVEEELSR